MESAEEIWKRGLWPLVEFIDRSSTRLDEGIKSRLIDEVTRLILLISKRIAGRSIYPHYNIQGPYSPGRDEFDLDATLESYRPPAPFDYNDIVMVEKKVKKVAVALMLDVSNSMNFEKISVAAIAVGALAYKLKHHYLSIIAFNESAFLVKPLEEDWGLEEIVRAILGLKTGGSTNISSALEKGLEQLNRSEVNRGACRKRGVIITDGWNTEGPDPRDVARKFQQLDIVEIPPGTSGGEELCHEMAELGRGRHVKVSDFYRLTGLARIV